MAAHGFDYDLVVIGGGSGGLAASKEAAKLGAKVACLDFVKPSPAGTQWGLGGTCVNVGCIPKKLMHQVGILGESMSDAREMGWKLADGATPFDWEKMVMGVQDYIGSLNWGYRVALRDNKVEYINAMGKFVDKNTIACTNKKGEVKNITADKVIVAVGGRPRYPGCPGDTECCITSDDIFSKFEAPGKTLVIGASYISLECAGFLTAMGYDTTVMSRSIFLRGFDQEVAEHISEHMERHGTKMIRKSVPVKFEKVDGKVKVTYKNLDFGMEMDGTYDTVLVAVGRDALTKDLGLEAAGVEYSADTGKIPATFEQTNVENIYAIGDVLENRQELVGAPLTAPPPENIYAIGDVLENRQELTPVAIEAGKLLARRLYAGGTRHVDYDEVPTTVFTPLEYGCVGLSEEDATAKYGEDDLEVYISYFKPLEWQTNHAEHEGVAHREDNSCFAKLITLKSQGEKVVGFHIVGPNAGEITQGYAVAIKAGATKEHFDATIGIHPTMAEEFTIMEVTKRSGVDPKKTGC